MDFLKEGMSAFGGHHKDRNAPPEVYRPWIVEWDNREERWLFINEQTGERTFQHPGQGGGGYNQGGYGGGGYGQEGGGGCYEERKEEKKGGHGMLYGGLGAAAGLAAGAGLMYEGEKIHNDYDRDKYDLEEDKYRAEGYADRKFNDGIEDVEDAPENVARWTGREEQRVEDIPQDIDNDWDRAKYGVENRVDNDVDRVEDAPERVAEWFGRKDGDVERFDDNVDNAYDEGKYEGRNEDGW